MFSDNRTCNKKHDLISLEADITLLTTLPKLCVQVTQIMSVEAGCKFDIGQSSTPLRYKHYWPFIT